MLDPIVEQQKNTMMVNDMMLMINNSHNESPVTFYTKNHRNTNRAKQESPLTATTNLRRAPLKI